MSDNIYKDFNNAICISRGIIIQSFLNLETFMELYIANHFTKNDKLTKELISLIVAPRLTSENKRQVFIYLVDEYHPYFKKKYPSFVKDFSSIIEERNIFAHYPFDITAEAITDFENTQGDLKILKIKNGKDSETSQKSLQLERKVNKAFLNTLLALTNTYIIAVKELLTVQDGSAPPPEIK